MNTLDTLGNVLNDKGETIGFLDIDDKCYSSTDFTEIPCPGIDKETKEIIDDNVVAAKRTYYFLGFGISLIVICLVFIIWKIRTI